MINCKYCSKEYRIYYYKNNHQFTQMHLDNKINYWNQSEISISSIKPKKRILTPKNKFLQQLIFGNRAFHQNLKLMTIFIPKVINDELRYMDEEILFDSTLVYDSFKNYYSELFNFNMGSTTQINVLNEFHKKIFSDNVVLEEIDRLDVFNNYFSKLKSAQINIDYLNEKLKSTPSIKIKKLTSNHNKQFNTSFNEEYIKRFIKSIGYKYCRINPISNFCQSPLFKQEQMLFLKKIHSVLIEENKDIIFIDESTFVNNHKKLHGWKSTKEKNIFGKQRDRVSTNLLLAASNSKVIHYKFLDGSNTSDTFYLFIKEVNNITKNCYSKVYLMDNCKIHQTEQVLKYFKENQIELMFTLRFYPLYNSVEYLFSILKKKHYKRMQNKTKEVMIKNITKDINELNNNSCRKAFIMVIQNMITDLKNFK